MKNAIPIIAVYDRVKGTVLAVIRFSSFFLIVAQILKFMRYRIIMTKRFRKGGYDLIIS